VVSSRVKLMSFIHLRASKPKLAYISSTTAVPPSKYTGRRNGLWTCSARETF
jgi:hypothetical protein